MSKCLSAVVIGRVMLFEKQESVFNANFPQLIHVQTLKVFFEEI